MPRVDVISFLFSAPNAPFPLQCRQFMHISRFHYTRGVLVAHFAPLTHNSPRLNYDPFFLDENAFFEKYTVTESEADLVRTYDMYNYFVVAVHMPGNTTIVAVALYTDLNGNMLCNRQSPIYEINSDADDELTQRYEMVQLLIQALGRDASMPLTQADYGPLAQFIKCGGYCAGELRNLYGQRVCYTFSSVPTPTPAPALPAPVSVHKTG